MPNHVADKICKLSAELLKASGGKPLKVPYISSTVTVFVTEGFAVRKHSILTWGVLFGIALKSEIFVAWRIVMLMEEDRWTTSLKARIWKLRCMRAGCDKRNCPSCFGDRMMINICWNSSIQIPTMCTCHRIYFCLRTALHVLGFTITRLQEHKTTPEDGW